MRTLIAGAATGFLAGYAGWRLFETALDLKSPAPPLPKQAEAYGAQRRRYAVSGVLRGIAVATAFAYGPGVGLAKATKRTPVWLRPALFAALAQLVESAMEVPIAFVEDYTTERRYGLARNTKTQWLVDYAKGTAIGTGVIVVLATLFGAAVRRAPRAWPVLASIGALPLFVLGNVLVPLYVLPLFNKFEPLTGPLEVRLRKLAARFGVGNAEILTMDMSRQTSKANAFVAGIGGTHRIVIGDTLLSSFPEDEVEFVVAHELGHYVSKDTWRLVFVSEAMTIALFAFGYAMAGRKAREELREDPILLAQFSLWMTFGSQVLRPALFAFSRSREWAADRFAVETLRAPHIGAAAFRRLRDQNLAEDEQPAWYEFFFASHPSLKARIAALESQA